MEEALTAVVDLDLPGPTINRHLYGHFAEHLGRCIYEGFWVGEDSPVENINGIRADVVQALRALQIPNLRWPGGCFADDYHWMDGVGPRDQRPRMVNSHWGDVVENNHFGTHEFLKLCELIGAEPYISANVGSGTVRETSNWVEYLTRGDDSPMSTLRASHGRSEPWGVRFFGLGNEPWGCGGRMSAEQYVALARQHATYARNHGSNELYRIAAGAADDDYSWTETLMKQLSKRLGDTNPEDIFQAISFHYYTFSGSWSDKGQATSFTHDEHWTTMRKAQRVGKIIAGHRAVMDAYDPSGKIGLALDEWGTWWNVEPATNPGFLFQQNTMRDALVAAVHFEAFHEHAERLRLANIAQTVNVLQAMLLTEGSQLIRTPSYYVFEMSTGHHDARRLDIRWPRNRPVREVDGEEIATTSVTASTKDGTFTLTAGNLEPDTAQNVSLSLRGKRVGDIQARILVADEVAAYNCAESPDRVAPAAYTDFQLTSGEYGQQLQVSLPPASYLTLTADIS